MVIKLYTLFLGLLVALFVGVGTAALYPGPTAPQYPGPTTPAGPAAPDATRVNQQFQQAQIAYEAQTKTYDRNVSIIALIASIILLALGLTLFKTVPLMGDSLTLGAVFTLVYSIFRGFSSDNLFRFLVVAAGLAMAAYLGYIKFVRPPKHR